MLNSIIEQITTNTLSFVIAVIICIMIVLFIIKKLYKMMVFSIVILLIYIGYLFFTGQKVPTNVDELLEHGAEQLKKHQIEERSQKMRDNIRTRIKEKLFEWGEKEIEGI